MQTLQEEFLRGLNAHAVGLLAVAREVSNVGRHDDVGAALDRRGQDVAVIRVARLHLIDERLIRFHRGVRESGGHSADEPIDVGRVAPVRVGQFSPELLEDLRAPERTIQALRRHSEQRVPEVEGKQNRGIQDRREGHGSLLSSARHLDAVFSVGTAIL